MGFELSRCLKLRMLKGRMFNPSQDIFGPVVDLVDLVDLRTSSINQSCRGRVEQGCQCWHRYLAEASKLTLRGNVYLKTLD